jgi:hypothetical protein
LLQRSLSLSGVAYACAAAIMVCLPAMAVPGGRADAAGSLEERKLPMHFAWHGPADDGDAARQDVLACTSGCRGWISAVGVVTGDTPAEFDSFAAGRDLRGATIVLDSSGGSVLDAIKLGRQWRDLGVATTVGTVTQVRSGNGVRAEIYPDAYCESMCVFLLLSGKTRFVPAGAHVRVHQIWMGDRAEDATAANYSAQDVMIIERDVGRLAKYTFEMGGSGELLGLALSIPPWEPLHELTLSELRQTNLVGTEAVADVGPRGGARAAPRGDKPVQDRFVESQPADGDIAQASAGTPRSARTAEALPATERGEPTGP